MKQLMFVWLLLQLSKDQRLVYSGRLLQDHLQLRDVLRKVSATALLFPVSVRTTGKKAESLLFIVSDFDLKGDLRE